MSNPRNSGTVIGRLTKDPVVFNNQDGSKKVAFTLMADHDYTDAQGNRGADAVPVEAFVRATTNGLGPFASIHKGDLVAVAVKLRQDRYTKNGVEVFDLKAIVQDITFLEPRSVTQARVSERVAAVEAQNKALQTQTPAPAAAVAAPSVATSAVQSEELPFGEPPF